MVRYYRDPDGTQVLSSNDKTPASQTGIGKLPKLDSSDMDGLKQRIKELEDLLNKHNVNIFPLLNLNSSLIHVDSME
jgi:hypothetical protein